MESYEKVMHFCLGKLYNIVKWIQRSVVLSIVYVVFIHFTIYNTKHNPAKEFIKCLLVLQNFSTARKSGNISGHTEKLFSSDTRQSMKRRIATERLSKIYSQMRIHMVS